MIIQLNGSSQVLITQPDHAALAFRIMRQWRANGFPDAPQHCVVLHAIEEHDNGWREADVAPVVDDVTGRVLDFVSAPDDVRRAVWPRGVERLAARPYAAALVAHHALHVYRRHRSDSHWAPFFTDMEAARDRHLHTAAPLTLDDLLRDYFFLRIGDLASLTFCNGWTEIQTDDTGSGYAMRFDGTRLTITPDPFEGREVLLEITARELRTRPFRSASEAQHAFSAAREVVVKGVASGGQIST
ncbi:MAG: DUF3891 family protein [Acidobacteria bacterium]|nr:DUF3891 family protein [Acidobacteriota bacterium]MCA1651249.1 DUF3891 family protein [Acidobacteriota bacterium]